MKGSRRHVKRCVIELKAGAVKKGLTSQLQERAITSNQGRMGRSDVKSGRSSADPKTRWVATE
jgi:hypothetical protein